MTEETIDPLAAKQRQYIEINDAWARREAAAPHD
jgi:hypothetical protein